MNKSKVLIIQTDRNPDTNTVINCLFKKLEYYDIAYDFYDDFHKLDQNNSKVVFIEPFDLECVVPFFGSSSYIYSAKLAIHCFEKEVPLPRVEYPIYSFCLNDHVVCCTEIDRKNRVSVIKIIQFISGTFSPNLTSSVTHLIVGKVGSKKYLLAHKMNIPMVNISWIYDNWKASLNEPSVLCTPLSIDKYIIGPFYGLLICITGFTLNEREKIKEKIIKNDGKYCPELNVTNCHVLVVGNARSKKVIAARKWKIPCVSSAWIESCITASRYCDIQDFLIPLLDNESPSIIGQTTLDSSHICKNENSNDTTYPGSVYTGLKIFKGFKIFVSNQYEDSKRYGLDAMIQQLGGDICTTAEVATHIITDWVGDCTFLSDNIPCLVSKWISDCYKNQIIQTLEHYIISNNVSDKENLDYSNEVENNGLDIFNANITQKRWLNIQNIQKQLTEFRSGLNNRLQNKSLNEDHIETVFEKYKCINSNKHSFLHEIKDINPSSIHPSILSQVIQYDDPMSTTDRHVLFKLMNDPVSENKEVLIKAQTVRSPVNLRVKQTKIPIMPNTSISESNAKDIYIQFSSVEESNKLYYTKLVQKLGGNVVESDHYDSCVTHTIVGNMVKSEKFLCSLAAGNWILMESFMKSSELLGAFSNESTHQWGTEANPTKLSLSCLRWRKLKNETALGAFNKWKVWLIVSPDKITQYKLILSSGGASVITDEWLASTETNITHIMIDKEYSITETLYNKMKVITEHIYTLEYILEFLIETDAIDCSKFLYQNSFPKKRRRRRI